ncbi:MAG: hypothetical protein IKX60_06405 [Bacteroidales bacterium]|nr:hypothetical protein [Bacteroidales bacterium]
MYKYFTLITVGIALLASCQNLNTVPVFDEDDAFVAFSIATKSVSEDAGIISIPVSLASIAGLSSTVSYEFVDGTAKLNENFKPVDETGILNFSSNARTANIDIQILDKPGVFTGDLKFTVKFKSTGSVKEGAENSCVVTITDNDHPLSAILGTYMAYPAGSNRGFTQYEVTITKDEEDLTLVWIHGLSHRSVLNDGLTPAYGNVQFDEDGNIVGITVPSLQGTGVDAGYGEWMIVGLDTEKFDDANDETPTVDFVVTDGGKTITMTNCFYVRDETYFWEYIDAPMPMIKQ